MPLHMTDSCVVNERVKADLPRGKSVRSKFVARASQLDLGKGLIPEEMSVVDRVVQSNEKLSTTMDR